MGQIDLALIPLGGRAPRPIDRESDRFRATGHLTGPVNGTYDGELRDLAANRFRGDPKVISEAQAAALIEDMIRNIFASIEPMREDISHLIE